MIKIFLFILFSAHAFQVPLRNEKTMSEVWEIIKRESKEQGVDPNLVASIISQESSGKAHAIRYEQAFYTRYVEGKTIIELLGHVPSKSICSLATEKRLRAFSFGLMQIMGQTAREHGFISDFLSELLIPENNIKLGVKILKSFLDKAKGNVYQALLFWNGGSNLDYPTQVLALLEKGETIV